MERLLRRLAFIGGLISLTLLMGTVGFTLIDRYPLFDAFYMTLITVSTVGYGEIHPLSHAARIFNSFLIFFGVTTMFFAIGAMTQSIIELELGEYLGKRRTRRMIEKLDRHFIICGYGRVGRNASQELKRAGVPFVIADRNPERVEKAMLAGLLAVEADATRDETLRAVGITRARGLVSAVDSDERAVYIVLAARAYNPNLYIVARAGHPESIRRLELAGASRTISPYLMAGHRMAELAIRPAMVDFLDTLHHGEAGIGVEEMVVTSGTKAAGNTLEDAGLVEPDAARVLAVRKLDATVIVNPAATTRLEDGDLLIALGTEDQLFATAAKLR